VATVAPGPTGAIPRMLIVVWPGVPPELMERRHVSADVGQLGSVQIA